jgi:hypothetical protein
VILHAATSYTAARISGGPLVLSGTAHRGRERREVVNAAERSDEPQTREPFRAVEHVPLGNRIRARVGALGAKGAPARKRRRALLRTPPAPGTGGQAHRERSPTGCALRGAGRSGHTSGPAAEPLVGGMRVKLSFVIEAALRRTFVRIVHLAGRAEALQPGGYAIERLKQVCGRRVAYRLSTSRSRAARLTAVGAEVRIDDSQRRDLRAALCELVEDGALLEVARTEGPLSAVGRNGHDALRSANVHLRRHGAARGGSPQRCPPMAGRTNSPGSARAASVRRRERGG